MRRIVQLGAYGSNLGDTVALANIRTELAKHTNAPIQWVVMNVNGFHKYRNKISKAVESFDHYLQGADALIIGGGGLIELGPQHAHYETKWKLPFNEKIFKKCSRQFPPIYVIGAGVNYFRDYADANTVHLQGAIAMRTLIYQSRMFSVRNDGSIDAINQILNSPTLPKLSLPPTVYEVPDPGLIYEYEVPRRTVAEAKKLTSVFQPAFNNSHAVMKGRGLKKNSESLKHLYEFVKSNNLMVLPHTPKDFKGFSENRVLMTVGHLKKNCGIENHPRLLEFYNNLACSVAMRGHGQMIALGLNVPSIYFSTQDKVLNFSIKHGLMDYNVDIRDDDWQEQLQIKLDKIRNDDDYRLEWYNKRDELITKFKEEFRATCKLVADDLVYLDELKGLK